MTATILFFIVLGVLVFVHELGHFVAARLSGVKVEEFGLGFPPKAFSYRPKNSEVEYSLNWLPIGGFVKIFGEDYEALEPGDPQNSRSFVNATKLRQIFIMVAGVVMNFVAAILLFTAANMMGSYVPSESSSADFIVATVASNSPAEISGLKTGDIIEQIEIGNEILSDTLLTNESFTKAVIESGGKSLKVDINRSGELKQLEITPQIQTIDNEPVYKVGVYADNLEFKSLGVIDSLSLAASDAWLTTKAIAVGFYDLISQIISGSAGETLKNLAGPIGIAQLSAEAYSFGIASLLNFAAFLSLNLVILNLLPIPALDGGRILFVIIEAIKGSRLSPKVAGYANLAGFGFLMLLMALVTFQDLFRLFK